MIFVIIFFLLFCGMLPKTLSSQINFTSAKSNVTLQGLTAQLILKKPIQNFLGTLRIENLSPTSIVQTDSASKITFQKNAKFNFTGSDAYLMGDMDFSSNTTGDILLTGHQTLFVPNGIVNQRILVSGPGNVISGAPIFMQEIVLTDSSAELQIALTNKLTNDIVLNNGTLTMLNDLGMQDEVRLIGPGIIDVNNFSLCFPMNQAKPMVGDLTFHNANDVTVTTRTILNTTWSFTGATSNFKGIGIIVDTSGGGVISIGNGTTLYVNGIHLKGIGQNGNIIWGNAASKFYLTTTILELKSTFTQIRGETRIEGSDCKIITPPGVQYVVSGATSSFNVDRQILWYECPGELPTFPLTAISSGTVATLNGGLIASNYIPGSAFGNINVSLASTGGANFTDSNLDFSSGGSLTFVNETPATPKPMVLDCKNNIINFGDSITNPIFVLQQNVQLTVQNVTLRNFDFANISLGASATISFGDGVVINFAHDALLSSPLNFIGNATLDGNGKTIAASALNISLTGANKTLTLRNMRLICNNYNSIKINTSTANLQLQSCEILLTSTGLTFDVGSLTIKDRVSLLSNNAAVAEGTSQFSFTTSGTATILGNSELIVGEDVVLLYNPNVSGDNGIARFEKRHFQMADSSSIFRLINSTLNTGSVGLALDDGKFFIHDVCNLVTSAVTGDEFELGSAVNGKIFSGAVLNVNGKIKYVPTAYP